MLRLGILGLGLVSAMVVFDCGGRTPLQDEDLFGAPGSITATGSSGTSTTGPGIGGPVTTGGSGVAGGSTVGGSGFGGSPGFGGTGVGTGGAIIIGTGGAPGFGGTATAGAPGFGGASGMGGFGGAGGAIGVAGAGGGPNPVRQLISDLPGTRVSQDCVACATMCQGSAACAANATCSAALSCAAANCGVMNRNPGGACLLKCSGGDPQAFAESITALLCVYDTCGRSCVAPRMR